MADAFTCEYCGWTFACADDDEAVRHAPDMALVCEACYLTILQWMAEHPQKAEEA